MSTLAIIALIIYMVIRAFNWTLDVLNLLHIRRNSCRIPLEMESTISSGFLKKATEYSTERTVLHLISSAIGSFIALAFLYLGGLGAYDAWIASFNLGFIASGVIFFLFLYLAQTVISIPASIYSTFRIESKYGFNSMTMQLWISDYFKSTLISAILFSVVLTLGLYIVQWSPKAWWFWFWLFTFAFSVFMMYVSPYAIEPLFNKYEELDDHETVTEIRSVMQKAGLTVYKVFKVDASRRSSHTNAYFTGIGRVKRIVLFDTLIKKLSIGEISVVLAHEAGHWRLMHVLKAIITIEAYSLAALYIAHDILKSPAISAAFGMAGASFYAKTVLLSFLASMAGFPLRILSNYSSRRHERAADAFAAKTTGRPGDLASALVKLTSDNLSSPHPHPLYAALNYSHPTAIERISYLMRLKKTA